MHNNFFPLWNHFNWFLLLILVKKKANENSFLFAHIHNTQHVLLSIRKTLENAGKIFRSLFPFGRD